MPKLVREAKGTNVEYELWEDGFFLGSAPSYSKAEKLLDIFTKSKNEFLRNYQSGKIPVKYEVRSNVE
jgi:hypothetical protein